jgi:transcription termination factor Rho
MELMRPPRHTAKSKRHTTSAYRGAKPHRPHRPQPHHRDDRAHHNNGQQQHQQHFQGNGGRSGPTTDVAGVLELHGKGFGFLRNAAKNYMALESDPYVSGHLISKFGLKAGTLIAGRAESGPKPGATRLVGIDQIEGVDAAAFRPRNFDALTPIDPREWLRLETGQEPMTTRVMDLLTPIGMGQRGLLVAPPRTGKTILLQHIGLAIAKNYPDMRLIMLLIDERPEEVTEMRRTIKGEVVASDMDRDTAQHTRLAELVVERAKRLAEAGQDVFLLLDSLTRLARAYNKHVGTSGRTMTGGIDINALEIPKRLFGTARKFEEGGSLTVIGTALIETGSRMDEIIFQEFKGTGNMELVLDRKLADRRVFPAMDFTQSGTRKEERLLPPEILKRVTMLRRTMVTLNPVSAMEMLVQKLGEYPSNAVFLDKIGGVVR